MKTKSKILKLIGIFFFLNSTITNAHIKCPFTVFGVTNDKCPVHNHNTFVENKGSKAKKNTPTLSKPKINLPPRPNLPSKPKISPQLKLPPRPKLPSIPTHAPKPKPPPPLDYRAIGRINDAAARTQENIQRKGSRLNQNFNDRKDALYNNTNRALENIHSNIEREKQNLSYEIDSISQQRRNFEINNPVDLQGLKNATKSAQDVVKFSTQGIGTSAIGKIKSPIRGTVSFDNGSNNTLVDKFKGGIKYYGEKGTKGTQYHGKQIRDLGMSIKEGAVFYGDKLYGGPETKSTRGSRIHYKISVVNQCHSDLYISLGNSGKPQCKTEGFNSRKQICSDLNQETLSWITISPGNTRTLETKAHWNYIGIWYQDKLNPYLVRQIHNWSYPGQIYPYEDTIHNFCTPSTAPGSVKEVKENHSLQVLNKGSIFHGGCPKVKHTNRFATRYEPIITHLGNIEHVINVRYEDITKSCDAEQSTMR